MPESSCILARATDHKESLSEAVNECGRPLS